MIVNCYISDEFSIERREDIKILRKTIMPDGTTVRLEENAVIAANPISCANVFGVGAGLPKAGERFVVRFRFDSEEHAALAFERLAREEVPLSHYKKLMEQPQYADCL
ncbi:MAG: hypothetical protein J6S14_12910 [Clostridia bacterium]|nr:hypothetical protein [Clostridia bacterium]